MLMMFVQIGNKNISINFFFFYPLKASLCFQMEMEKWDDLIFGNSLPKGGFFNCSLLLDAFAVVWEHRAGELTLINAAAKSRGWQAALGAPSPTDYSWIN